METKLLMLNENCISAIFKYLDEDDSMNFGDTCTRLQKLFISNNKVKFSSLTIDENVISKGIKDRFWYYYGQHLSSIEFVSVLNRLAYRERLQGILTQLQQHCVHLQEIKMFGCNINAFDQLSSFQNVEKLTMYRCNINNYNAFFTSFVNLKQLCVDVSDAYIESIVSKFVIPNNNNIETLAFSGAWTLREENSAILKLPLTKLKLSFGGLDGLELLKLLREKGIKELQLDDIVVNESTFDIIKSFDLHLLSVSGYPWNYQIFSESFVSLLTSNLKNLRLCGFTVSLKILISIVERLKFLEHIDVYECKPPDSDSDIFHDSVMMSQELKKAVNVRGNLDMLTVTLPRDHGRVYPSRKTVKESFVYIAGIRLMNNSIYYKTSSPFFDPLPDSRDF